MVTHTSKHLLTATTKVESKPEVKISQVDQKKSLHTKDYTSSIIGWVLQGGVMLSAGIILIGLIMLPFYSKGLSVSGLLSFPQTFSQIWARVACVASAINYCVRALAADCDSYLACCGIDHSIRTGARFPLRGDYRDRTGYTYPQ